MVTSKTIRATQFELVDDQDNLLAILGSGDNLPHFQLYDKNHHPRLTMCIDDDNTPGFCLWNENGSISISLGTSAFGTGVNIYDELGKPSIFITANSNGTRTIHIFDSEVKTIWKQGVMGDSEKNSSDDYFFE